MVLQRPLVVVQHAVQGLGLEVDVHIASGFHGRDGVENHIAETQEQLGVGETLQDMFTERTVVPIGEIDQRIKDAEVTVQVGSQRCQCVGVLGHLSCRHYGQSQIFQLFHRPVVDMLVAHIREGSQHAFLVFRDTFGMEARHHKFLTEDGCFAAQAQVRLTVIVAVRGRFKCPAQHVQIHFARTLGEENKHPFHLFLQQAAGLDGIARRSKSVVELFGRGQDVLGTVGEVGDANLVGVLCVRRRTHNSGSSLGHSASVLDVRRAPLEHVLHVDRSTLTQFTQTFNSRHLDVLKVLFSVSDEVLGGRIRARVFRTSGDVGRDVFTSDTAAFEAITAEDAGQAFLGHQHRFRRDFRTGFLDGVDHFGHSSAIVQQLHRVSAQRIGRLGLHGFCHFRVLSGHIRRGRHQLLFLGQRSIFKILTGHSHAHSDKRHKGILVNRNRKQVWRSQN